jgi:hypothetical protein
MAMGMILVVVRSETKEPGEKTNTRFGVNASMASRRLEFVVWSFRRSKTGRSPTANCVRISTSALTVQKAN